MKHNQIILSKVLLVVFTLMLVICTTGGCAKLEPTAYFVNIPKTLESGQYNSIEICLDIKGEDLPDDYVAYLDVTFQGHPKVRILNTEEWTEANVFPPGSTIWALHDDYTKPAFEIVARDYLVSGKTTFLKKEYPKKLLLSVKPRFSGEMIIYYRATIIHESGDEKTSVKYPSKGKRDQQNHPCEVLILNVK
ncbi:MAG: hypothetical protein HQ568_01175 [Calditrichaeota bacterium]|nr:hypothetical protein [Calditrichota bacterium]